MFSKILNNTVSRMTINDGVTCMAVSLIFGLIIAFCHAQTGKGTKSFLATLVILPTMVQTVIMLVNGNLGTGVAIVGAFSLVRYRSLPGTSREIGSILYAMVVGLATGMGYITYAAFITLFIGAVMIIIYRIPVKNCEADKRMLKITTYEDIDYTTVFDDIFEKYLSSCQVESVKTTNMGSMYQLTYAIEMKDKKQEKELIDEIRCRNGNLTVICGRIITSDDEQL